MTKHEIAKAHYKGGVFNRRTRALGRLEQQLKENVKPIKFQSDSDTWLITNVPLEEKDVKRIKSEISTLKSRI